MAKIELEMKSLELNDKIFHQVPDPGLFERNADFWPLSYSRDNKTVNDLFTFINCLALS